MISPDTGTRQNTSFDAAGNVLAYVDARGATATTTYDALNRPLTVTYSDGATITYTYDTGSYGIGRLTQMVDPAGTTAWGYNINGHVISKTEQVASVSPTTLTTSYTYNSGGRSPA